MIINNEVENETVENDYDFLPSVEIKELVQVGRIDNSQGSYRLAEAIIQAYDKLKRDLLKEHFTSVFWSVLANLDEVPCTDITKKQWMRTYKRAVIHEAAAYIHDNAEDTDTTGVGQIRAENTESKSDRLRRIVNHCIADMTGKPRNRVRLL